MTLLVDLLKHAKVVEEKKTPYGVTIVITRGTVLAVCSDFYEKLKESQNGQEKNIKGNKET